MRARSATRPANARLAEAESAAKGAIDHFGRRKAEGRWLPLQIFLLGGAALAIGIAVLQPRDKATPTPSYVWTALGILLARTIFIPAILLIVIVVIAFALVFRGLGSY